MLVVNFSFLKMLIEGVDMTRLQGNEVCDVLGDELAVAVTGCMLENKYGTKPRQLRGEGMAGRYGNSRLGSEDH